MAALATQLTEELVQEGLAREFVRRVQTLRKEADFDISDHITVTYQAAGNVLTAVRAFADYIQRETLADQMTEGTPADGYHSEAFNFDGEPVTIGVRRV